MLVKIYKILIRRVLLTMKPIVKLPALKKRSFYLKICADQEVLQETF